VRTTLNGEYLSTEILAVEPQSVSYTEVQPTRFETKNINVFNPFDRSKSGRLSLSVVGLPHAVEVEQDSLARLQLPSHPGVSIVEALPVDDNTAALRAVLNREQKEYDLPVVTKNWLHNLKVEGKINQGSGEGSVLIFLNGHSADGALLDGEKPSKALHFDRHGDLVRDPYNNQHQVKGILIYGLSEGTHSFTQLESQNDLLHNRLLFIDSGIHSVISL
jgi:hypothetical protein